MKLGLIFTRKISLATWDRVGTLDREVSYYNRLATSCETIFFFTHGTRADDARFQSVLASNIELRFRPWWIGAAAYVFLMPLIHARTFRIVDIIKTNQMDGSWAGVIAKKLFKKKLVVRCGYEWLNYFISTNASWYKRLIARIVEHWSYRHADRIIITSEGDKKFILENFHIPENHISVVGNFIDTKLFSPDVTVSKESGRIMFVGRLHKDKNLALLIESLVGLPCQLVLAGKGPDADELFWLANTLGVSVAMQGAISQEQLANELQTSELFVLPSRSEGNPKALLEAMSCGLAVVGTNVKGIREIIEDGVDGLLAQTDVESLRTAIKSILENPELRDKLGARAREKILREYSLDIILAKELSIYESLV